MTYGVHRVQELKSSDPTWMADAFEDVLKCIQAGLLRNGRGPAGLQREVRIESRNFEQREIRGHVQYDDTID